MPARNPNRAAYRAAGKRKRAQRAAARNRAQHGAAVGAAVAPLAFARDADARHALDVNPNRGKRHAAPASTRDPRTTDRKRTEPRKTLLTYSRNQPSLPPIESKNIPRAHGRGVITS